MNFLQLIMDRFSLYEHKSNWIITQFYKHVKDMFTFNQ